MYTCLQCQTWLKTCDPFQLSRMCSYRHHSWSWGCWSDEVCQRSALMWKLSSVHHCSLALQESMVQWSAGKRDYRSGYMTVLVVNHGMIQSISILTVVIHQLMIKFDLYKPQHCFRQDVKWTLAIRYQLSTLSRFDLRRVFHLPHNLLQDNDTDCLPEGNRYIPNALWPIQSGGDLKALLWYHMEIK